MLKELWETKAQMQAKDDQYTDIVWQVRLPDCRCARPRAALRRWARALLPVYPLARGMCHRGWAVWHVRERVRTVVWCLV